MNGFVVYSLVLCDSKLFFLFILFYFSQWQVILDKKRSRGDTIVGVNDKELFLLLPAPMLLGVTEYSFFHDIVGGLQSTTIPHLNAVEWCTTFPFFTPFSALNVRRLAFSKLLSQPEPLYVHYIHSLVRLFVFFWFFRRQRYMWWKPILYNNKEIKMPSFHSA